ncbi:MAG: peptidoglycan D,D-transpeptidase FtsI family protein, partial [Candidatus Spyradocola sp.]
MQGHFGNQNNGKKGLLTRYIAMAVVVLLLFAGLTVQLASLQLRDGEEYNATAESRKMKTYTLKGERGMILDRNGIPLAYDEESYNVTFYRDPSRSSSDDLKNYTQILLRVMEIVERNGGQTVSGFYLKRDADGNDYLDFLTENEETFAKREKNWRENFYITKVAEEDIFGYLCRRYGIEDLDYDTQYKVLSIWQELQMNAFLSKPVVIAYDVNMNTVSQIEAASIELTGAAIEQTTKRVYPHGTLAAHIVGYMGAINEDNLEEYVKKGYSADDRVGVYGIEKSMEDQLSGNVSYRQGSREVEVDANGAVMRELSYKAPVSGNNVVLTIDLEYQQILEESLAYNIEEARKIQLEALNEATDAQLEKYKQQIENRDGETLRLAATGAAVVLDVHTGEVLAMASYPSFDPNDFVRGMSTEEYNEKYNIDTSPLFNRAISTKATPGSIFKMVTALAGLEEGVVTVDEQIDDESPFTKYDSTSYAPKCWTKYPSKHAGQNVTLALTNSCNYYFYTVADRLGIDNLYKWASLLGLTSKTGIELSGETTGVVGNQSVLYDSSRGITSQKSSKSNYVARTIMKTLRDTG